MTDDVVAGICIALLIEGFFGPIRGIVLAFRFPKNTVEEDDEETEKEKDDGRD